MTAPSVHVAVGVIVDAEQRLLVALRPEHSHQGGLWEFPGGKVESGEGVQQALQRELLEELNIEASGFRPLIEVQHDYGDKTVLLDVWWVDQFKGEAIGREGQTVRWVYPGDLSNYAFPEANQAIIHAVKASIQTIC
ncbi:MAG: 8-oxo-dGTP diphosphatase MutT [Spongiibacteraceae bacterium]|nr:8-oxo-dGTP diphosphatase MutT [Spongiibacteraceae bacterium]